MTVAERFINRLAGESEAPLVFRARSCLRNRLWSSTCACCVEECPRQAVSLEQDRVVIDSQRCVACLICVAVCPAGALVAHDRRLDNVVARTFKLNEPVACCCEKNVRTGEELILSCLGALTVEHLAAMAVMTGGVNLHLESCGDCRASFVPAILAQRVAVLNALATAGSEEAPTSRSDSTLTTGFSIKLLDQPFLPESAATTAIVAPNSAGTQLGAKPEIKPAAQSAVTPVTPATPDRRSFFRAFRELSWHAAATTWSTLRPEPEEFDQPSGQDKQAIARSIVLRQALTKAAPERRGLLPGLFYVLAVNDKCNLCGACAGVCPTGALSNEWRDGGEKLWFNWAACSGCGLCCEFCPQKAISLRRGRSVENMAEESVLLRQQDVQLPRGRRWTDRNR
ncbi:MAG: hypothetical protein EYX74_06350 [Desulfobulbaceae bacterium]|nr:MAG: hypothetical protein EYX74_06350 [Desulfobulbaceae bacterium]